jgi:hypothetical protein
MSSELSGTRAGGKAAAHTGDVAGAKVQDMAQHPRQWRRVFGVAVLCGKTAHSCRWNYDVARKGGRFGVKVLIQRRQFCFGRKS